MHKRKSVEEDEESMVRQTTQYLKTLKNAEAGNESEGLVEIEELAEVEVNYHSARNQFERFRRGIWN